MGSYPYIPLSVVPGYQAKWVWVDEAHVTHDFVSKKGAAISYPNPRTVILAGDVQPIVAEDKIFFGACSGEFYALDPQTGRELWRKKLGGQSFMYSWPVVHQGLVMTFIQESGHYQIDFGCLAAVAGKP